MPSLYGVGISFRLAAQPLATSLTEKVESKRGYQTASNIKHAEKALMDSLGTPLPEDRVPFPGDKDNFALNWLGEVQFLQAVVQNSFEEQKLAPTNGPALEKASRHVPEAIPPARSTRALLSDRVEQAKTGPRHAHPMSAWPARSRPQLPSSSSCPESRALILYVKLSDKTFLYDPFDRTPQQLKIEVFFNGQLANCMLLHARDMPAGKKSFNLLFAGTRVDYHAERPWVMHTPNTSATAETRPQESAMPELQSQWAELCNALLKEANTRGMDETGRRPPTARYLRDLATMQMPDSVKNMQKAGSFTFGVIDVAVTVGSGRKMNVGVECLRTPTRLHDERYEYEVNEKIDDEESEGGPHPHVAQATVQEESLALPAEACPPGSTHTNVGRQITGSDLSTSSLPMSKIPDSCILPDFRAQGKAGEPSQRRSRAEAARVIHRNPDPHATRTLRSNSRMHTSLSHQSSPSNGGHSILTAHPLPSSRPQTQFNVNQYDSFEHANPYQSPYLGMASNLNSGFWSDPKPLPLRSSSSAYITAPPPVPTSDEVPSKTDPSVLSSPYLRHTTTSTQKSGNDPLKPGVPRTGRGLLDSSSALETNSSRRLPLRWSVESNRSLGNSAYLPSVPRASTAYVPAHLVSSSDLPPPAQSFMIAEMRHANLPGNSRPLFPQVVQSRIDLKRVVIRLDGKVVRSHFFMKPRTLTIRTPAILARTVNLQPPVQNYRGGMKSADMLRRSNALLRADSVPVVPPQAPYPSTRATLGPEMHGALHSGMRSPSHRGYHISNANANAVVTGVPPKASGGPNAYGFTSENSDATILGEQGSSENRLSSNVVRKPSMNENLREMARYRSTSSGQANMTPGPFVDGPSELENDRKMDQSASSEYVDTVTRSFLSGISEGTGSSFPLSTIDTLSGLLLDAHTTNFMANEAKSEVRSRPSASSQYVNNVTGTILSGISQATGSSFPMSTIDSLSGLLLQAHTFNETQSEDRSSARPHMEHKFAMPLMASQHSSNDVLGSTSSKKKRILPSEFALDGNSDSKLESLQDDINRSDTRNIPPSKKGCVIELAVAGRDGSALRQIRSERMAIFEEENVIVGCRYFVSGC